MNKIPTLFVRDPETNLRYVTRDVNPQALWVLAEGVATRKYDGTCVKFDGERWWARREVKPGKDAPAGFEPVEMDEVTGKTVGWEPAEQSGFAGWLDEARAASDLPPVGTYELCGPKINGNPEGYSMHVLVPHGRVVLNAPRDFDGLRDWLQAHDYEGIVWHHPDGRMAKLKKRDFPDAQGLARREP